MAQKITNILAGLPQDVTIDRYEEHNKTIELFISYRPEERTCPYCKSHDCVIHSSGHTETVRHLGAGKNQFLLTFHAPRRRCKSCGMTFHQHPYLEKVPDTVNGEPFSIVANLKSGNSFPPLPTRICV